MTEGGPSPGIAAPLASRRLAIDVVRHMEAWAEAGISDAMLERAARAALSAVPDLTPADCEIALVLTDDAEMRRLNRTWRGKDSSTNVLSFPAGDSLSDTKFLGDVVIAYGTAVNEAREGNLKLPDHVSHLVVHGVLHLLGMDHTADRDAERMEAIEREALAALGIADPYAEADEESVPELSS